jgi:hypothetical protein
MKTEAKIQQEIVMKIRNEIRQGVVFSVPNESKSKQETMQKKAIGMLAGVSDLIWVLKGRVIFIEVKSQTGTQSDAQKEFQKRVETLGWEYYLARDCDKFFNDLKTNKHETKHLKTSGK